MITALVTAETSTTSGFSFKNLLILIVVLVIAVPLVRKLRRSVSARRRRRWAEEGLMDPPADGPDAKGPSE